MNKDAILNLNGEPFASAETAEKLRDLLNTEAEHFSAGCRYKIDVTLDDNNTPKFVVARSKPSLVRPESPEHVDYSVSDGGGTINVYHPALRVYIFALPWFAASAAMYLFAKQWWIFALTVMGVKRLPAWFDVSLLVEATSWVGFLWLAWLVIGVLLKYYGTTLTIDDRGISYQRGILVRDVTNVRFHEIRRVGLRQGLLDRLLNIGILEFASSGTDDVDIRFVGIANPERVRAEIEERVEG